MSCMSIRLSEQSKRKKGRRDASTLGPEPHHLWQDLGLRSRAELGVLTGRHFPRLRALTHTNMRWKRFFYRQICSDPGLAVCLAPTCDDREEKDLCFGPEEGPALLRH